MTWHGQINRSVWELEQQLKQRPGDWALRREFLRTHFLQRFEYDRSLHVPRDDRSFLFLQEGKACVTLLLHGAHGTPAEMRDLGNYLYGRGLTVYCPRLSRVDLKNRQATWESWVTMAETALTTVQRYSNRNAVVGLSFGATIALFLQRLHRIGGIALLAPALYPRLGLKGRLRLLARYVAPTLFFRFAGWNGEVLKGMESLRRSLGPIKAPVFALHARDDHVLSQRGMKALQKACTHAKSEMRVLPHGGHALTRGPARDEVSQAVFEFLKQTILARSPRSRERRSRAG